MYKIVLTVETREDVEDIQAALSNAEEEGEIGFAFGCEVREAQEIEEQGFRS